MLLTILDFNPRDRDPPEEGEAKKKRKMKEDGVLETAFGNIASKKRSGSGVEAAGKTPAGILLGKRKNHPSVIAESEDDDDLAVRAEYSESKPETAATAPPAAKRPRRKEAELVVVHSRFFSSKAKIDMLNGKEARKVDEKPAESSLKTANSGKDAESKKEIAEATPSKKDDKIVVAATPSPSEKARTPTSSEKKRRRMRDGPGLFEMLEESDKNPNKRPSPALLYNTDNMKEEKSSPLKEEEEKLRSPLKSLPLPRSSVRSRLTPLPEGGLHSSQASRGAFKPVGSSQKSVTEEGEEGEGNEAEVRKREVERTPFLKVEKKPSHSQVN